jgi:hypothetical protein
MSSSSNDMPSVNDNTSDNNIFSATNLVGPKPLFNREMFVQMEAELAHDNERIKVLTRQGQVLYGVNRNRGIGLRGVGPSQREPRNTVAFQDERNLKELKKKGMAHLFAPVHFTTILMNGPNRTEEQTRVSLQQEIANFEASDEALAMANMIKTHLKGCAVDKVIGFGLGAISKVSPNMIWNAFREHAAARVIARAVQEVSSAPRVQPVLVQDPAYTDVCRNVLEEFGISVIEGFGAKGFALMDDNSIILVHNPSFPARQIIADLARPALLCMKRQAPENRPDVWTYPGPDARAEVDSVRSRKMLEGYHEITYESPKKVFYSNTWYVRTSIAAPDDEEAGILRAFVRKESIAAVTD